MLYYIDLFYISSYRPNCKVIHDRYLLILQNRQIHKTLLLFREKDLFSHEKRSTKIQLIISIKGKVKKKNNRKTDKSPFILYY